MIVALLRELLLLFGHLSSVNIVVPQRAKDTLKNKELEEQFNEALCEAEDLLNRKGWIPK